MAAGTFAEGCTVACDVHACTHGRIGTRSSQSVGGGAAFPHVVTFAGVGS